MGKETAEMLDERIKELLYLIDGMSVGSQERAEAIKELRDLHELKMAEAEHNLDIYEKCENIRENVRRRHWQSGIDIGKFIAELGGLAGVTYLVLVFEETGSIVSAAGRQVLGKVFKVLLK